MRLASRIWLAKNESYQGYIQIMGNSENQMKYPAFKAKIFIPSKGIDWRINSSRLLYGGFISLIIIAFIASQLSFSLSFDYLIRTLIFSLLGLILYASYWGAHENEKKVIVFFQLETPSHKVELRRLMRLLYFNDRIDLSTTYLGLNLEFEEIQELKKAKIKYLEDQQSKVSS